MDLDEVMKMNWLMVVLHGEFCFCDVDTSDFVTCLILGLPNDAVSPTLVV
jgi:hypothetical protein